MRRIKQQVDRVPPNPTGDNKADIQAVIDYLAYIQDEINRLISILNREE